MTMRPKKQAQFFNAPGKNIAIVLDEVPVPGGFDEAQCQWRGDRLGLSGAKFGCGLGGGHRQCRRRRDWTKADIAADDTGSRHGCSSDLTSGARLLPVR